MSEQQDPKERQFKKFKKFLDEEWRNDLMGRTDEEVDKEIRTAAMNLVTLEMAKEFDEDLKSLKDQLATANAQYTDGKKTNLVKIEFLIEVLRGRGVDVPSVEDFIRSAVGGDEAPKTAEDIANAAAKSLSRGLAKAAGLGGSVTVSSGGRSVTVKGE
jgi:hypothetical protein